MKNRLKVFLILLTAVIICFPVVYTFYKQGLFTPAPTVTTVSTVTDVNAETLTFAMDYDFDPYSYLDKNGDPSGLNVEIATEIANRMGRKAVILTGNWQECKAMIKSSQADVLAGLEIFADESKTSTLKTIPISHDSIKVYGKTAINDVGSLSGKRVGISAGSIITKLYELNCEYVGYNTNTEILQAVANGEVDYGIVHGSPAEKIIEKNHLDLIGSATLMESFPAFGIRETAPELEEPINDVIKSMADDGTINKLYDKWIGSNLQNKTLVGVFASNQTFYISYAFFAMFALLLIFYVVSVLHRREHDLETALSYQKVLETEKQHAEAANIAKSIFLSNMSHDIRTPMNAIIGFNAIASQHLDDPKTAQDALAKSKDASEHMMNIINDILDMSRIESGRLELHEEVIDVKKAFTQNENMFRLGMEQKGLHFIAENTASTCYVYGDDMRIKQVITNLLSNAMKFTPAGGTVLYRCEESQKAPATVHYDITVKDTGIGMSEEYQKHLFQPFERERTATESGIQGTGLGLSIAKKLTDLMGGTLTCTSQLGKGTTFVFSFDAKTASDHTGIQEKPEPPNIGTMLKGRHILLVEDNQLNQEIACHILTDVGCSVDTAKNGAEAVDKVALDSNDYDLILMDIQMPVMDGYQATKEIRKLPDPRKAKTPIIAMSANAFEEDIHKATEQGMNGYITKPIDVPKMLEAIQSLLSSQK